MPGISDSEPLTLAVMRALLGFAKEDRWPRYAPNDLRTCSIPLSVEAARVQEADALPKAPQ